MNARICIGLAAAVAALGCADDPVGDGTPSRDEARRTAQAAADDGRDLCAEYGWYGDGICDEFCVNPDEDCTGACAASADCPQPMCEPGGPCPSNVCVAGQCEVGETCTAELLFLQKDAYLSRAGRSEELWPPHTTTVLTVACDGAIVATSVRANHGTLPDAVDPVGTPILVEVHREQILGRRAELDALVAAFDTCECGTEFLSLDSLDATLVNDVVTELSQYLDANLVCPSDIGGTAALVSALTTGDIDFVVDNAMRCTWASGADWNAGLNQALQIVASTTGDRLSSYHVCNNDAVLQAHLFAEYASNGAIAACDAASPVCSGPRWYYTPATEPPPGF